LSATIKAALDIGAKKSEFEHIIVDTTAQEKAIAHPTDSRLLDIARYKAMQAYAQAKQFNRLGLTIKCQKTILEILLREVQKSSL
jgi:IS5 family transposase